MINTFINIYNTNNNLAPQIIEHMILEIQILDQGMSKEVAGLMG